MAKKKIHEFLNKPAPVSADMYLLEDSTTGIYYNVTQAQLLALIASGVTLQQVLTNNPSTGGLAIKSPDGNSVATIKNGSIEVRSIYVHFTAGSRTSFILDSDPSTGQAFLAYDTGKNITISPSNTTVNHATQILLNSPLITVSQDPTTALGIATMQFVLANVPSVPVTSVFGRTGTVIAVSGDYTTALVTETTNLYYTQTRFDTAFTAKSTTNLTEGTNLYFTNPRSIASTLTSYVSGAGAVSSADSIISAIQKLNGNIALVSGAIVYQGLWNASTNTPTLVSGVGTKGTMYKVSVAGTTTIDGISQWNVGDQIMFDGTTWDKLDGIATEVLSVNGAVGAVTLTTANVSEVTNLYFTTARAITALTGQSNALFTNGAGYLVANQTITLSGDVTGSGTIAITTAISNTVVTGKLITGYVSGVGTVSATDSILQAIQKLNGNMAAAITGVSSVNTLTGAVTLTTANIADSTNKRYQTDLQQTYNDATSSIQNQLNGKQPAGSYEVTTNKDTSNGYAGLTLFKINFKNVLNTITSFFTNSNTASRTYTFKDADGTVAFTSDITGVNSNTNTGDNATNTQYANDYRLANFVAGTNYLAPNGSAAALTSFPTFNQNTTGNASTATNLTGLTTTVVTLNNTSGTNTGDNATNTQYSGLVSNATHTGDASGATVLTLATVNANVGSFGSASNSDVITVNGKGLITAISSTPIQIAESQVTNLVSDLAGKQPTGTYASGTGSASGVNTGDETAARIATINHSATVKSVLVDADELTGQDSASTFSLIRTTLLNIFTYIQKKFETKTLIGDAAYSILASDNVIMTSVALTLPRIWTLPSASSVNAGNEKIIDDAIKTITATNTITVAVQTGQYLNNVLNGTDVIATGSAHRRLISDGVNNWTFDAGIARLSETQTLLAKTLVTPVIGSITGVSGTAGLTVVTNNTASSAIARGSNLTPTLIAAANNDVLVGLDINPTFTNGAFTGVSNLAARIQGGVNIGNASPNLTTLGILRIGQGTSKFDFGQSSGIATMWANQTTNTAINYSLLFDGSNNYYNTNSGAHFFYVNNSGPYHTLSQIQFSSAVLGGANGAKTSFLVTVPNTTTQTLSTNIPQVLYTLGGTQWATGAITTQKFFSITAPTASFVGASTITTAYATFIDAPIAGTNATITNNYALGLGGSLALANVGSGISIKEGLNATMGIATLVGGTVTVSTTKVTANSRIFLEVNGGTVTNVGFQYISTRTAGTSFTINSVNVLDASNVAWIIIEPA